ncbi:gamma-glutamyltransferase [Evansella sp. AB-rgal1]|uniref:gamma-glutamyltransferase n=1 Tax=Evansella sp. AB-rgal1 TaxID=3242696 RepID=UPI00359E732A
MWMRRLTNLIGIPLIIVFIVGAWFEVSPEREEEQVRREALPPLQSENAYAVSAAHEDAVDIGMWVMEQGGNAIDAAIAVSFMLGVVEPYGSGIGGGGSMLIYDPNLDSENKVQYVDYRETAPLNLVTSSMVNERRQIRASEAEQTEPPTQLEQDPTIESEEEADQAAETEPNPMEGSEDEEPEATQSENREKEDEQTPADIQEEQEEIEQLEEITEYDINSNQMRDFGVPGFLKGMAHLHEKYGTMDIATLIEPSIEIARNGFEVDDYLTDRFFYAQNRIYHASIPHFFPNNDFIRTGDTLIQEELAQTLEQIRDVGPERYFHEVMGPDMSNRYPVLAIEDFNNYSIWEEDNIPTGEYQGYTVYSAPPPLGGAVLVQALHMAEEMGLDIYNFEQRAIQSEETEENEQPQFGANWTEQDIAMYIDFMESLVGINDRTYRKRLSDIGDPNTSELAREKMNEIYTREYAKTLVEEWERELERIRDELLPGSEEGIDLEDGTQAFLNPSSGTDDIEGGSQTFLNQSSEGGSQTLHNHESKEDFDLEEGTHARDKDKKKAAKKTRFAWGDGKMSEKQRPFFRQSSTVFPKKEIVTMAEVGENESTASPYFDAESELNEHNNTTHFVIVDKDGRMVSATHTLSNFFGSGEYFKGFFLNDQLSNFSQTEGSINEPRPGRRPRSFMSPTILIQETEGHVGEIIGVGSPGGARIPNMIAQALVYHGLQDMEFDDAVEMLRFQYDFNEGLQDFEIRLEQRFQNMEQYDLLRQALQDRGFRTRIEHTDMYFGGIQALIHNVREGVIDGNADPRRGGKWDRAEYDGDS